MVWKQRSTWPVKNWVTPKDAELLQDQMAPFDIEKLLWHFQDGSPTLISQELPKLQEKREKKKTHSYLADVQCNLLFYLQTETYVGGLFAGPAHYLLPPLCYTFFPPHWFTAAGFLVSPSASLSHPLLLLYLHLYHPLRQSSQSCLFSSQFTLEITVPILYRPSGSLKAQGRPLCSCCLAPLGPLRACVHLKRFTETHICCFRAQRDFLARLGPVWSGFTGGSRTRASGIISGTIKQC